MTLYLEENLDMPLGEILPIIQHRIMSQSTYFGVRAIKNPLDLWVYQEIIHESRPDVIIEIGNAEGGSTLALAHICDLLGRGRVIGVDLSHAVVPECVKQHPRITFIEGDACRSFESVERLVSSDERVLIIEDSSHTFYNTLRVLRTYSPLVKPGDYFIIEDGISHHGLSEGPMPGPYEAIEAFAAESPDFEIDRSRESFLITWNLKGYLKRRSKEQDSGAVRSDQLNTRAAALRSSLRALLVLFTPPVLVHLVRRLQRGLRMLRPAAG